MSIARSCYGMVLRLHPAGFQREFAAEMMRDFEEAVATFGAGWLLRDAMLSALRQRLVRAPVEVQQEAFGLLAGSYPVVRAPHLSAGKLTAACVLSMTAYFLFPPLHATPETAAANRAHRLEVRHAFFQGNLL